MNRGRPARRNGKRIDIVVRTDDLALGIENKIGAKLYNDLGEYAEHVEEIAGSGRRALLITLTVDDETESTVLPSTQVAQ